MSTRCIINFCSGKQIEAKVYRHHDGYPDGHNGVLHSLQRFFAQVERDTSDTRFNDPTYLAAKYVVWQARENAVSYDFSAGKPKAKRSKRLDFLGVGIVMRNPDDLAYVYRVDCRVHDEKGRPIVGVSGAHDGNPHLADMTYELPDSAERGTPDNFTTARDSASRANASKP